MKGRERERESESENERKREREGESATEVLKQGKSDKERKAGSVRRRKGASLLRLAGGDRRLTGWRFTPGEVTLGPL